MFNAILIVFLYFFVFFIVATIITNNSIVDIGWGLGFVVTSWILFGLSAEYTVYKIVVNVLLSIWGLRLFYHILKRNAFKEEDFRYAKWREDWGSYVIPRAFLQVFMLQGLFMLIIGSAVFYINIKGGTFNWVSYVGIVVFFFGLVFESIGDKQLKNHISSKNRGLLTTGLWKYTRHPNYFGEAVLWWGLFLIVFGASGPLILIVSPIAITILLRFVSGVPMLEKKMSKKEGWNDYARSTNAFIPWVSKQ